MSDRARREIALVTAVTGAIAGTVIFFLACVTSGTLPQSTPRLDATSDAHWVPVVLVGFDSGPGGKP